MRKSKGRGEKTAANGRVRMERGNECERGAGVVRAERKRAKRRCGSGR